MDEDDHDPADDFAPVPQAQHDLTGTETAVGALIKATRYVLPVLPHASEKMHKAVSQLQFKDLLYALLGGLNDRMACSVAGIPRATHNDWMRRGLRGVNAEVVDVFSVYYCEVERAKATYAAYLAGRLLSHVHTNKDPKALIHAMKLHGFENEQTDLVEEETKDEALYEDLGKTLPKVQV